MTVLTVDTYAGISDNLPFMWPYYLKAGVDVVGIERTNKPTRWPTKDIPHFAVGEDYFTSWANKQDHPFLCQRWLGIIELFLTNPFFDKYDDLCMIEWDVMFCKPLPPLDPVFGLCMNRMGGCYQGFKAPCFFHLPWWMDKLRGQMIVTKGNELIAKGDIEHGSVDFFMGLVVAECGLPFYSIPFFSRNRLDCQEVLDLAKAAIRNGAYGVHGVRDEQSLKFLLA